MIDQQQFAAPIIGRGIILKGKIMARTLKRAHIGNIKFVTYDNISPTYFAAAIMEQLMKELSSSEKAFLTSPTFSAALKKVMRQISFPVELSSTFYVEGKPFDVTPWIESALGY